MVGVELIKFRLSKSHEMITLIVGPTKVELSCHKIVLGYYSTFFRKMLFGNLEEAGKSKVNLPEVNASELSAFINWAYTGDINASHERIEECIFEDHSNKIPEDEVFIGARLWVLGDKLLAPKFRNDAMRLVINYYRLERLNATTAEYVYANTSTPESKLRSFTRALIEFEGPLAPKYEDGFCQDSWILLLAKGGDLVKECVKAGFHNKGGSREDPAAEKHELQYLEEDVGVCVAVWLEVNIKA